ncbi:MAG TPA: LacI family DNA-binding transcriptional regulator [Alphaproteobacteria bacterium]|nr:LacI family DNA-binding transcriptional regulator [Alphaproteobacteria bacterium]
MTDAARRYIRLADVAKRLGLTTVAVSKALRDMPDISVGTRELIKKTAAEMGYVPNYLAKSLQSNRSNLLGVVVPKIRHPFFAEAVAGIQSAADARGYEMVLAVSNENAEAERRHIETFMSMRTAGLLIAVVDNAAGVSANADIYRRALTRDVPLVFFDRIPAEYAHSERAVLMDDRAGAQAAVSRAIDRGCRKVAHFAVGDHINVGRERRAGFEAALVAHGIAPRLDWIVHCPMDERGGYDGLRRLWNLSERPDAILFSSSPQMLGAMDALKAMGAAAGNSPLAIFFGLPEAVRFLDIPYICAAQPAFDLGARTVEEVLNSVPGEALDRAGRASIIKIPIRIVDDTETIPLPYL